MDPRILLYLFMAPLTCIILYIIIKGIYNMINSKKKLKEELKKVSDIDINELIVLLVKWIFNNQKMYGKVIRNGNCLFYINEYYMYVVNVIHYNDTLNGELDSEYWTNSVGDKITNPLKELNNFYNIINKIIDIKDANKYLIFNDNCIIFKSFKGIKKISLSKLHFYVSRKDNKKNYSKMQIDDIYNKLLFLNEKDSKDIDFTNIINVIKI